MTGDQPTLFDMAQAKVAGEVGMGFARTANQRWQILASAWFDQLEPGTEFQADDLIRAVGLPVEDADDTVNRQNVVGAWMSKHAGEGRIRKIGYTNSSRVTRHGSVQRRWRKT